MGNSLILKEREGFNLGDGKFSGIPQFGILKMRISIFRNDGVTRKIETLGKIDASQNAQNGKYEKIKWRRTRVFYLLGGNFVKM